VENKPSLSHPILTNYIVTAASLTIFYYTLATHWTQAPHVLLSNLTRLPLTIIQENDLLSSFNVVMWPWSLTFWNWSVAMLNICVIVFLQLRRFSCDSKPHRQTFHQNVNYIIVASLRITPRTRI